MKLAISNIAWPAERELEVVSVLKRNGVDAVELAPTKNWPSPPEAPQKELEAYRRFWNDHGIEVVAAQALLYGRPDLTVFENPATRAKTVEYLRGVCRSCATLGAKSLVFGSPKNRQVGSMDKDEAQAIAIDFFGQVAEAAVEAGTTLVLEANPTDYAADFVTNAGAALELVRQVDHPGLRLHLDTACMHLAGDDAEALAHEALESKLLQHVHFSAPYLAPLVRARDLISYAGFAKGLRAGGYRGYVSIEMRTLDPWDLELLDEVICFALEQMAS
jgi:sugar phosphate isomerase/epimerase